MSYTSNNWNKTDKIVDDLNPNLDSGLSKEYFISDHYWEQNNPSALCVKYDTDNLYTIGHEQWPEGPPMVVDEETYFTEFEKNVFDNYQNRFIFHEFIQHGIKHDCINLTSGENNFELYKKLYGNKLYVVLESRAISYKDPSLKRSRWCIFLDEYLLALMNSKFFISDDHFVQNIAKSKELHTAKFEYVWTKLYRCGFRYSVKKDRINYRHRFPTAKEYYSHKYHEDLSPKELGFLLFRALTEVNLIHDYQQTLLDPIPFAMISTSNIIGIGWLPALFSKTELNELDRFVLGSYENGSNYRTERLVYELEDEIPRLLNSQKYCEPIPPLIKCKYFSYFSKKLKKRINIPLEDIKKITDKYDDDVSFYRKTIVTLMNGDKFTVERYDLFTEDEINRRKEFGLDDECGEKVLDAINTVLECDDFQKLADDMWKNDDNYIISYATPAKSSYGTWK